MRKKMQRILAVMLCIAMVLSTNILSVFAVDEAGDASIYTGNLLKNPGFEADYARESWEFVTESTRLPDENGIGGGGAGVAEGSSMNHGGTRHFFLDAGTDNLIKQTVTVPYNGTYRLSAYLASGSTGGEFGVIAENEDTIAKMTLPDHVGYSDGAQTLEDFTLNQGDTVTVYVSSGNGWINGDDFALVYVSEADYNLLTGMELALPSEWSVRVPYEGTYQFRATVAAGEEEVTIACGEQSVTVAAGETESVELSFENCTEGLLLSFTATGAGMIQDASLVCVGVKEYPEPEEEHGLRGDYYTLNDSELTFDTYKGTYIDSNIASNDMSDTISERTGESDYVAVRWTGQIVAPENGNYTFFIYSDNGVRVWIDDELIIDWWVNQWDKEQSSAKIPMKKGEAHTFKMEWFEYNGGAHVTLNWANDGSISKTAVPASAFYLPVGFQVVTVQDIDVSGAQLNKGAESFGGSIKIAGEHMDIVETVEVVDYQGLSLSNPVYADVIEKTETSLTFAVPDSLETGTYNLKLSYNDGVTTTGNVYFQVINTEVESSRTAYPRPDWEREKWMNLNGSWDFTFDPEEIGKTQGWYSGEKEFSQKINVPYCWESSLSGIGNTTYQGQAWYQRQVMLDETWLAENQTVFIKFGAVDAKCTVYVNGQEIGSHNGGYSAFEFDITDYAKIGENTITVWVEDKGSYGDSSYPALIGKQGYNAPVGYTHTSGIWQTVYLEGRSETWMDYAHANTDVDNSSVAFEMNVVSDEPKQLTVEYDFVSKIWDENLEEDIPTGSSFNGNQNITVDAGENKLALDGIVIENVKLWDDVEPNLYYGTLTIKDGDTVLDQVQTYFGMCKISMDSYEDRAYDYINVNDRPVFLSGVLDQGFWSDGIYTAPTDEALKYDVQAMKDLGFNMIRKHLKIEDPIQYYWADKLGMYIMQDMPHVTAANASYTGAEAKGRAVYEQALEDMLNRDYNHPSIFSIILFNENNGISQPGNRAADGMTTVEWQGYLYDLIKDINSNLLVEDMSPTSINTVSRNHIQPTDINTFHMYPKTYEDTVSRVASFENSQYNFMSGYSYDGEPWLNSEYGGVGCHDGDYDVSYCFKYQTDVLRQYQKLNGLVYTEPYDIEFERNGFMTEDRRSKEFGYEDIAYGGDMSVNMLTQANYVGVAADPAKEVKPGGEYSATIVAMNWSGDTFENAVLNWRFDATDGYGNYITTGISGSFDIEYPAYTVEREEISFNVPNEKCVGTLTVWIEEDGEVIAKNFTNVIVWGGKAIPRTAYVGANGVTLRANVSDAEAVGTEQLTYVYTVPKDIDLTDLDSIRIIAEVSSLKEETVNNGIENSATSQTAEGSERPSDLTVWINGIEVDTVYLPDNPRDMRGTLSLTEDNNDGTSAGNYGYLVNIRVSDEKLSEIQEAIIADNGKITVSYGVKADAEHQNGLRMYNDSNGRYAVRPTIILNPADKESDTKVNPESENYTAQAELQDGGSISLRGGAYDVVLLNGTVSFGKETASVGEGSHLVTVKLFDEHVQIYVDNNPEPVIDTYDYSAYTTHTVTITNGTDLVVSPETYVTLTGDEREWQSVLEAAKDELEAYRATKSDADYRDAQVKEMDAIVESGCEEIEKAATEDEVADALAASKTALDAVKTDAQLTAEEQLTADEQAGKAVKEMIAALGEITLESEDAVNQARTAYEQLTPEAKTFVDNLSVLEDAEIRIEALKNEQNENPGNQDGDKDENPGNQDDNKDENSGDQNSNQNEGTQNEGTGNVGNTGDGQKDSPITGDSNNIFIWIAVMVIGVAGVILAVVLKRRSEYD